MATRYVDVPIAALEQALLPRGFAPERQGNERLFVRRIEGQPRLAVVVYSSASVGAALARDCGEDAIRVLLRGVVRYEPGPGQGRWSAWTLHKCTRIHRTGSVAKVIERVLDRITEAEESARRYAGLQCERCGCLLAWADSGRCISRDCRDKQGGSR